MTLSRRTGLAALSAVFLAACAARQEPVAGVVAFPARTLSYAPLLAAVSAGLYADPKVRVALMQRRSGSDVAAVVADGTAIAGALPLEDLVQVVSEGAPLVAIGALTRRLPCQLVIADRPDVAQRSRDTLSGGDWRGMRLGVEGGPGGTERFVRFHALAQGVQPTPAGRRLLATDPASGEPRWLAFETPEALVAALKDNRLDAFVGPPFAAAQTITLGGAVVATNFLEVPEAAETAGALPTVLVAHRDSLHDGGTQSAVQALLRQVVQGCARAAADLAGPEAPASVIKALPERDPLHVTLAVRLASPSPGASAFAAGGKLAEENVRRYLELSAMAGRAPAAGVSAGSLSSTRFSG